jgi:hypothetical protein
MIEFFEISGRRYARFVRLGREPGLVHAFATRPMDVSMRRDDRQHERAANRATMARDLARDPNRLSICRQVHATTIAVLRDEPSPALLDDTDGVLTNIAGRSIMTFSADCPLIIVFDPVQRAVGLVHASWRCTAALITRKVVDQMRALFGSSPGELLAGIGPGAGPCCYEVRDDVYQAAAALPNRDAWFPRRAGRMFFDLWGANRAALVEAGLADERIESADVCTMCRTDLFFSFRREGAGCGHFGLMAGLTPDPRARR